MTNFIAGLIAVASLVAFFMTEPPVADPAQVREAVARATAIPGGAQALEAFTKASPSPTEQKLVAFVEELDRLETKALLSQAADKAQAAQKQANAALQKS